jgi:Zn-dependent protease
VAPIADALTYFVAFLFPTTLHDAAHLNLLLFLFNLLPFVPLDGSAAITRLMDRETTAAGSLIYPGVSYG